MSLLAALATMPADFLPPLDGDTPVPQAGDPAYTVYRGTKFIGTLAIGQFSDKPNQVVYSHAVLGGHTYTAQQYGWQSPHVWVGYDGPIVWDAQAGMWNCYADHD